MLPARSRCSQCLKKRDQCAAVIVGEIEPEFVSLNGASRRAGRALPAGRNVIRIQALRIEPVFQGIHRTAMLKKPAIPYSAQRRYFVQTGALARAERQ